jgi:hypothetical protein
MLDKAPQLARLDEPIHVSFFLSPARLATRMVADLFALGKNHLARS